MNTETAGTAPANETPAESYGTCAAGECDYLPTDGLLDRNGYETRKCCNCGDVADFFVRTYYGDCDGPSLLSNGRGGFSPEQEY